MSSLTSPPTLNRQTSHPSSSSSRTRHLDAPPYSLKRALTLMANNDDGAEDDDDDVTSKGSASGAEDLTDEENDFERLVHSRTVAEHITPRHSRQNSVISVVRRRSIFRMRASRHGTNDNSPEASRPTTPKSTSKRSSGNNQLISVLGLTSPQRATSDTNSASAATTMTQGGSDASDNESAAPPKDPAAQYLPLHNISLVKAFETFYALDADSSANAKLSGISRRRVRYSSLPSSLAEAQKKAAADGISSTATSAISAAAPSNMLLAPPTAPFGRHRKSSSTGSILPFIRRYIPQHSLTYESLTPEFLRFASLISEGKRMKEDLKLAGSLGQLLLEQVTELEGNNATITARLTETETQLDFVRDELQVSLERNKALSSIQSFRESAAQSAASVMSPSFRVRSASTISSPTNHEGISMINGGGVTLDTEDNSAVVYEYLRHQIIDLTRSMHESVEASKAEMKSNNSSVFSSPLSLRIDTTSSFSASHLREKLREQSPLDLLRTYKQIQLQQTRLENLQKENMESIIKSRTEERDTLASKMKIANQSLVNMQVLQRQVTLLDDDNLALTQKIRELEARHQNALRHRVEEVQQSITNKYTVKIELLENQLREAQQSVAQTRQRKYSTEQNNAASGAALNNDSTRSPALAPSSALQSQYQSALVEIEQLRMKLERSERIQEEMHDHSMHSPTHAQMESYHYHNSPAITDGSPPPSSHTRISLLPSSASPLHSTRLSVQLAEASPYPTLSSISHALPNAAAVAAPGLAGTYSMGSTLPLSQVRDTITTTAKPRQLTWSLDVRDEKEEDEEEEKRNEEQEKLRRGMRSDSTDSIPLNIDMSDEEDHLNHSHDEHHHRHHHEHDEPDHPVNVSTGIDLSASELIEPSSTTNGQAESPVVLSSVPPAITTTTAITSTPSVISTHPPRPSPLLSTFLHLSQLLGVHVPHSHSHALDAPLPLTSQVALSGVVALFQAIWSDALRWYAPQQSRLSLKSSGTTNGKKSTHTRKSSTTSTEEQSKSCHECGTHYTFYRRPCICGLCSRSYCSACTHKTVSANVLHNRPGMPLVNGNGSTSTKIVNTEPVKCCDRCYIITEAAHSYERKWN